MGLPHWARPIAGSQTQPCRQENKDKEINNVCAKHSSLGRPGLTPEVIREEEEQPWASPSLGGTEYSGPSLSVSKEEKELSETHADDGGSMKLGL